MDTQLYISSSEVATVFLRMTGLNTFFQPSFVENPELDFMNDTNTLFIESPLETNEDMKITILVDKENVLVNKKYTLCSFVDKKFEELAIYTKTVLMNHSRASYVQINFNKIGLNPGEKFDVLVYYEQLTKGKMVFLSEVNQFIVGEITLETIHEINETYSEDSNYLYKTIEKYDNSYYFSYLPESTLNIPIGAFSLELDTETTGEFLGAYCTFVQNDSDAMSMIEAVENAIDEEKSYCLGGVSGTNSKRYNYIFKYEYEKDNTPKKMVIKLINNKGAKEVRGKFNIYIKKDQGEEIVKTDFSEQKEYGKDETNKKTVIPYIVDLKKIRGDETQENYISKVLFYSRYLEMQMYYLPKDSNAPIKLFCGNIALVYTKPQLAEQKYHSSVLILITENLEGKVIPSIGGTFRFHTKMFKSDSMIEFFVSQNPSGRTLNFPLSLEMNSCSADNNKLYYLLNYNEEEPLRRLHLDMIFGKYLKARIAKEINQNHWDDLIEDSSSMVEIEDFKAELPSKSQHIDIIEITCETPLIMNAYYTQDTFYYADIEKGGVVIKSLPSQSSFDFSFKEYELNSLEYSISLYNPIENPDVTVSFSDGTQHRFTGNSLMKGILMHIPKSAKVINNLKTETRFIFKFGLSVESTWIKEETKGDGDLYYKGSSYVYKFPYEENKKDFMSVSFLVKSIDQPNIKFCYSTNLGVPIDTSRENCFRTGTNIPYTLTFINPLIIGKNYETEVDLYYISFKPFNESDEINLEITENKYSVKNRNELGIAKELFINNGNVSTILSMPSNVQKIFFQIQSCTNTQNTIQFNLLNAFTGVQLHYGKIKFTDPYGVYYISPLDYMENQIDLIGDNNVRMFTKHAAISNTYSPTINTDYKASFDSTSNVVTVIKPIKGEAFNITIIIKKTSLDGLTICDLAFNDLAKMGDYVKYFISTTSDLITHFVDFEKLDGYSEGTKFLILVHAVQMENSKMEFIYPIVEGEVGTPTGTVKISEAIDGEYIKADFTVKTSSNYFYYDFPRIPLGNVASLRVKTEQMKINKVGCVFVSNQASEGQMISEVNAAIAQDKSVCIGGKDSSNTGFDALVNAKYSSGNNRLVVQVLYGIGEDNKEINEETSNNYIVIKNGGTELNSQGKFPSSEPYSAIPYVIDLLKIRGEKEKDYVSKILFYSNTREMQMFYVTENDPKPVSLFTGNIMMVYTNEELIKQKYQGATLMILLTDALSNTESAIIGEQYRFITYFFNSEKNIQYFLSSNAEGRPLNNPTAIEMTSCDQPYYYIMNYNKIEGEKKLHIDTVFGERNSIKIATRLNMRDWDSLIENMQVIKGEEVVLEAQNKFHFDVIEVTCTVPLLVNLFYTEPTETKVSLLEIGDITILSLEKGKKETLTFKPNEKGPFVYSFTIDKDSKVNPKISITFDDLEEISLTKNGVYSKYALNQYSKILISNQDNSGNVNTRIIFKFGLAIESIYEKDENGIYSNKKDTERIYNLYGYIYDQTASRLNNTGVDFEISTTEDNVKFCYSTNLGTYIYPSLQNCYRVGKNNPYTIKTLNPYVMYKDYFAQDHINYYVSFRTVNLDQNIIIKPSERKYDTTERNMEGVKNKVTISTMTGEMSTILTAPKNNDPYVFIETCLCTKKAHVSYQFLNAYNGSNLGSAGELNNNQPKINVINNPKLDTELKISKGQNGYEIFVKHAGYASKMLYSPQKIKVNYNRNTNVLNWTQPLINENFNYSIYIDKINNIKKQNYTLCDIAEVTRLSHYMDTLVTNSKTPNIVLDFSKWDLNKDSFGEFDIIIIAEQLEKQKFTFMSATYDSLGNNNEDPDETDEPSDDQGNNESGSNTGLIVVISILSVVIIGGIIAAVLIFLKYRNKTRIIDQNKQTSMALLNSTQQDKLVESQAQVDP